VPAIRNALIWDAGRDRAEYGDIVVKDGFISSVTAPKEAKEPILYDCKGKCLVLPGLVNAHTHVSMTLLRGLGEELPLMEWLQKKIFPVEDRLTAQNIRSGADLAIMEMLAAGVTCFADMYYFMDEVAMSVLESGIRAALCRGLVGDDPVKLAENLALAETYNGREGRITVQLGPHATYTVQPSALEQIAATARDKNLGIHFHWLETKSELDLLRNEYKTEPADYLEKTGLLGVKELILAHCVWHPAEQLPAVARDNVTFVHNPKSNMKLGSGYAPVREFMSSGVRVALGTDGAASNNRLDLWDEMRFAALIHKGYNLDPTIAGARDILKMATVNGSYGAGFKDAGYIRAGQRADMVIVDMDNPRYVGCDPGNVPEFVVYAGSSRDVRATVVDGKVLYRDGEFATLDSEKILAAASRDRRILAG
jgi:5-methylthioadenosine/S-adenosylhomocysteine deaminase